MIFDVKFDLRRNEKQATGGHRAPTIFREEIYLGVFLMESIRTVFVLGSLNDLEVCVVNTPTIFLYGKTREKVYVIAGDKFGEIKGKRTLIDKDLYGLASSAARFHETLSSTLRSMSFTSCRADHGL